jgi:hypothetical protein
MCLGFSTVIEDPRRDIEDSREDSHGSKEDA